jgi:hypothetical protein
VRWRGVRLDAVEDAIFDRELPSLIGVVVSHSGAVASFVLSCRSGSCERPPGEARDRAGPRERIDVPKRCRRGARWVRRDTMRTPAEIRQELARLTDERTLLWKELSEGHDGRAAARVQQLNDAIDALWLELRRSRNELRYGPQDQIIARARAEARIDDELRRRLLRARRAVAAGS